jgi:signal transduction histidine kinase
MIDLESCRTGPQAVPLAAYFRQYLKIEKDPSDPLYRGRYAVGMIEGFRILSLVVFASMAVLLAVHLVRPAVLTTATNDGPTAMACAILACVGGVGLLVSRSIRSPDTAFLATAALVVAAVAVITVDRSQRLAGEGGSISSIIPIIFSILVLSAALLPLRPRRVLGLGALLIASSGLTAALMGVPFFTDFFDVVSAATMIAVSGVIAARSTSNRIRIHHAHVSAMQAERQAEAARERALIAESTITMERLAASLSHEMNTPIGALRSATETLLRGIRREASFPPGSRMPQALEQLSGAIGASTARLTETVARIQRFANLDRSTVRLVDVNQIVQDAVALMNPPSASQTRVKLNLSPLPHIWGRPHGLSVAIASILNAVLDSAAPATIDTYSRGADVVVKIACSVPANEFQKRATPGFAVVGGRVRASGWDLFAARQLLRESGGELRLDRIEGSEQVVTLVVPANAILSRHNLPPAADTCHIG